MADNGVSSAGLSTTCRSGLGEWWEGLRWAGVGVGAAVGLGVWMGAVGVQVWAGLPPGGEGSGGIVARGRLSGVRAVSLRGIHPLNRSSALFWHEIGWVG